MMPATTSYHRRSWEEPVLPTASGIKPIFVIPRDFVEPPDLRSIVDSLSPFIATPAAAQAMQGRLHLTFQGYDDDPRGLWDIPEARTFATQLEMQFPYWFFLADLRSDTLQTLALCVCALHTAGPGANAIDAKRFDDFFDREMAGLTQMWNTTSLSPTKLRRTSDRVKRYFASRLR